MGVYFSESEEPLLKSQEAKAVIDGLQLVFEYKLGLEQ